MLFQLVQLIFWTGLSTWFGSVLFIALASPVIFATVKSHNPILTNVLSVNLEGQHSTLLAGSIVVNLIDRLRRIEIVCAGLLLIALIAQPFVIDLRGSDTFNAVLRTVLFLAAVGCVLFDWQMIWPRLQKDRDEYIDHADEPEIANPARERFARRQKQSITLMTAVVALLLLMILCSATIQAPRAATITAAALAK